ncbi:hypothetical protein C8E05_1527 [Rhodococcus wratislaviensis]|nr:hypothetical protein C8E05_1527 [Rhodococcus wratislaviensis]
MEPHYSEDYKTELLMWNEEEVLRVKPTSLKEYESKGYKPMGWTCWKN